MSDIWPDWRPSRGALVDVELADGRIYRKVSVSNRTRTAIVVRLGRTIYMRVPFSSRVATRSRKR